VTQRSCDGQGVLACALTVQHARWRDEDEAVDQVGRRGRDACADDATERVSHEVDPLEPEFFEQGVDKRVGIAQDERASSRRAEPRKVDEMNSHALRKWLCDRFPPTP
jgi:hypothetical protein